MADFDDLARQLRALMKASAVGMIVVRDGDDGLVMNAPIANPLKPGQPMWFGEVRTGKSYVSYHLMPVYSVPTLARTIPAGLKKRMQGKSCFNFKTADPALFADLAALTAAAAEAFSRPLVLPPRAPRNKRTT